MNDERPALTDWSPDRDLDGTFAEADPTGSIAAQIAHSDDDAEEQ